MLGNLFFSNFTQIANLYRTVAFYAILQYILVLYRANAITIIVI